MRESASIPTLDECRALFDPDGFFLEKELIQSYLDAYPQAAYTKHKKRQQLIDKQVAVLKWIEPLITAEPVRDDWVAAWFDIGWARFCAHPDSINHTPAPQYLSRQPSHAYIPPRAHSGEASIPRGHKNVPPLHVYTADYRVASIQSQLSIS